MSSGTTVALLAPENDRVQPEIAAHPRASTRSQPLVPETERFLEGGSSGPKMRTRRRAGILLMELSGFEPPTLLGAMETDAQEVADLQAQSR